ncbi:TRAP transporter small permease [Terasakiella sp. SH-1]|uniref:TRAP transporter small permease subunit n=1 Tax=Terasakiella sp. SH-1 TaxID=2560057 RepID=UPI001074784B|nr:TRAP transporter small permease [Terasakiella sp. SH-1]
MPQLETSTLIWIGGLSLAAILWMIFVSPRLVPMLAKGIHHSSDDEEPELSIIDKITLYMSSILMFKVAFIVAIMFLEVILRYVFNSPTIWVEELSRWLGGMVFLLGGLYAMQQRSHIRVVILYDLVSRPVQRIFDAISLICILIFCYAVTTGYWKNAMTKLETWELYGSAWNPPIPAIMKPLIVLTMAWMAVQAINNIFMDWSKDKEVHDIADDV